MQENSQLFMGVQPDFYFLVEYLASFMVGQKNAVFKVMLTLRKIRLNEVFEIIALYMGISVSHAADVFRNTLPTLASCFLECIMKIDKKTILRNLPTAFRLNYSPVTNTVDGFEIQIETPSNAMHRAVTWSSYKGSPTLKYLVSITPDGYCNKMSRGYGGRNSDIAITNDCGLLDTLERGSAVLADRGFKHIEAALDTRGVTLLRPPSVSKNKPMSKVENVQCRQVAAVRIHVERYIGRLRNFQFIAPHATVPVKMIPLVDACVVIAAGLTNVGTPLMKGNTIL
jgi:DDE superfamily endonuclease